MEINLLKRKIGLNFLSDKLVEVSLWAPFATFVSLAIPAKKIILPMLKQEYGYWQISTNEINEGDEYYFKIWPVNKENNTDQAEYIERADPASVYQKEGISKQSTAFNLISFKWNDENWKGISLEDYIIYELHTGTFTPIGDFKSIESKLDYLVDLGINAIEIMPVSQFPGGRNWGYDGVYPFAVQNTYGGPKALQHLVNKCHEKGLAVILDVVYNHMGPEGNYFNDFGPYFTDKYHTPWGSAINFDDANCDAVRAFFIENVLMWFRDFHIDALRLDAVHAIKDFSAKHILAEIKSYVDQLCRQTNKTHHLIVELDLNDNKFINPLAKNGFGMDAQWIDEFHHALRVTAGEPKNGYYADFDGIEDLAKSYGDAYVYDGQYSTHRQKKFGAKADENAGEQFVVFSQNHDQVGNRMLGERTSKLFSFEMLKLMAGTVFCAPFLPLIFMGEEYAEENPFQFFISHNDDGLVEAVRKGRKAEFAAFHHNENTADPQSEETFNRSKLNWDRLKEDKHKTMLSYYQSIIKLRKSLPSLSKLNRNQLSVHVFKAENSLVLTRWDEYERVICYLNFANQKQYLPFHASPSTKLKLNSASKKWGGADDSQFDFSTNQISIYPESILIFSSPNV